VTGNLYLVGGGDPLLRTPDYAATLYPPEPIYDNLATLADRVKAAGVTAVTGSVVGDESRYDTQRVVPTWPPHYLAVGEVGPLSALSVNDGFAAFKPTLMPAPQPAQQAAATFTTLLQGRGISVAGPAAAGTAPPPAVRVADLMSAPLSDELGEILRSSDNNGAELITKELGRHANAATPTTRAGVTAIQTDIGADGGNRVTCQLILAALMRSGPDGALARDLPVAAKSGTLINRMAGTPAAGRLRAKTGTLDGVAALSGFVTPPPGSSSPNGASSPGAVTFSLITNAAPSVAAGERLGNLVGAALAQFPQVPPIAALAP
jgi:D-alanyl-D-alanine carboxypeptidase/D-alanyl-D-alanine-endopeptidase (penicillin-binding protein 4)